MKVMVFVKASAESEAGVMPTEQELRDMTAFNEKLNAAEIILDGQGLHPTARGKRIRFSAKAPTVVDGPFAETKELIAGFWVWEVKSMEEAVAWARQIPFVDGEVEIRPIFGIEDFGDAMSDDLRQAEEKLAADMSKRAKG